MRACKLSLSPPHERALLRKLKSYRERETHQEATLPNDRLGFSARGTSRVRSSLCQGLRVGRSSREWGKEAKVSEEGIMEDEAEQARERRRQ